MNTLKTLYEEEKKKDVHAESFIRRIAKAVERKEGTVMWWIYGYTKPSTLERREIANVLGIKPEELQF